MKQGSRLHLSLLFSLRKFILSPFRSPSSADLFDVPRRPIVPLLFGELSFVLTAIPSAPGVDAAFVCKFTLPTDPTFPGPHHHVSTSNSCPKISRNLSQITSRSMSYGNPPNTNTVLSCFGRKWAADVVPEGAIDSTYTSDEARIEAAPVPALFPGFCFFDLPFDLRRPLILLLYLSPNCPTSDFKLPTSVFKHPTSDFKQPTSVCKSD